MSKHSHKKITIKELFLLAFSFTKIGLFTIGGGLAMLPLIEQVVVEKKKWLTNDEMVDCFAVSQSLPGIVAINAATYVGYHHMGFWGALFATAGVVMPSFVIIILLAGLLNVVNDNEYVIGVFSAVTAAACGLIFCAALKMSKNLLTTKFSKAIAIISFLLIMIFGINVIWVILLCGFLGLLKYRNTIHIMEDSLEATLEEAETLENANENSKENFSTAKGGKL